ncbi:MAG: DUF58 domain-containing protein [Treponema sp.]|nr:DUF58 domain-containing protein [Treponema sp.]
MPGWKVSNRAVKLPVPGTTGLFIITIAALALLAGFLRNELVLILLGTVFLVIAGFCFLALLISCLSLRRIAQNIKTEIITKQLNAGANCTLHISGSERFFVFPGVFARYRQTFSTLDGKTVSCIFNPRKTGNGYAEFSVPGRGAYFNAVNELMIMDAPGFFRAGINVKNDHDLAFLAVPRPSEELLTSISNSGGEKRSEIHYRKTDNLTENRPYVPGDDPRRINWKLWGHGPESELYVREGENAPVPHSRLLILIDTQTDPVLFKTEEAAAEIDLLCENALKAVQEWSQTEIRIGYTGGNIMPGNAASLAWPAALPLLSGDLPSSPDEAGILILAAPRLSAGNSALDKFLAMLPPDKKTDLVFLFSKKTKNADELGKNASACTSFYRRRNNISVSFMGID